MNTHVQTHTDTQDSYCNPPRACTLRVNNDAEGNQESKQAGSKVGMAKTEPKQNKNLLMVKVYQLHLHGVRGGINVEEGDKFCLLGEGLLYKLQLET